MPSRSRASSTTPLTAGSSSTISIFGTRTTLRQLDLNYGTHALFGLQRNAPAHPLYQVLADGQPQPEALACTLFSGGFSPPVETFEDVGQVGIAYPRPFVLNDHGSTLSTASFATSFRFTNSTFASRRSAPVRASRSKLSESRCMR